MANDEVFNAFVAGYVTGEGSFWITLQSQAKGKPQAVCGFSIRIRKDDLDLLREIWKALGYAGNIHPIPAYRYRYDHDNVRRHDSVMLIARSNKELISKIIPFFDKYELHGNKRRNYDLWKIAVKLIEQGAHLTPEGLMQIIEIKSQMNRYIGQDESNPEPEPTDNNSSASQFGNKHV